MFSDIVMPGLDGTALLQLTSKKFPALPMIIMTAADRDLSAQGTVLKGACDYLVKLFDRDQPACSVRRALDGTEYACESGVQDSAASRSEIVSSLLTTA